MEVGNIKLKEEKVFGFFLFVRLLSVLLVQTFYVPDEYWQSLEVAHNLTFGYGYLTWEWSYGIRSYVYPLIISVFYKIAQLLGADYAEVLIYMPKILQAILSAYADLCFYRWTFRRKWAIFLISTSFFWYYAATRTLLNTFETALTTIALSKYPWIGRGNYNSKTFLILVALTCVVRPTAALFWLPMCSFHLITSKEHFSAVIIRNYLPIGLFVLVLSILIDSLCHGSFVISAYEFFKLNLIEGVGEHYGSQPWHWYLSQGLPAMLGINLLTFVFACLDVINNRRNCLNELALLFSVIFCIFTYSIISHKEFRFILPLLPVVLHISAIYLAKWSINTKSFLIWLVSGVILIGNLIPAWYIGLVHQRGTLEVMQPLREIATTNPNGTSYLFLMPCHSTPLYSYLHVNVTARFLTCEPNFNKVLNYTDEADRFYKAPNVWLKQNILNGTLPTHLIMFDSLEVKIQESLSRYKPLHRIFHTSFPTSRTGRYVMLYQRVDLK